MKNIKSISNSDVVPETATCQPRIKLKGANGDQPALVGDNLSTPILVTGKSSDRLMPSTALVQSILGDSDRRTAVEHADKSAPWRMICSLNIFGQDDNEIIGTGWIAGPRLIITAGHCLYHPSLGGWAKRIEIRPGNTPLNENADCYISQQFAITEQWHEGSDENFDYGAIFLEQDISSHYGHFSIMAMSDSDLADRKVNISGYPASYYGDTQMHHQNRIKSVSERKLYYDVDTGGGQSGSPVWVYEGDVATDPVVIGVHAYGGGSYGIDIANSGVRVVADMAKLIEVWRGK